jgi:DNA-binding transcriptional LysR family regulator
MRASLPPAREVVSASARLFRTYPFLNDALTRFRELFPLVEVTVLQMDNRGQIDALLDGSIMLGIGYTSLSLNENRGEQLTMKLLLRSPNGLVCSKHRCPRNEARQSSRIFVMKTFWLFCRR